MTQPLLSLLVPTAGRATLRRCLESIRSQEKAPPYEVIVIGDTFERELPEVRDLVKSFGRRFRYAECDAGHHCFGHCPLNHGIERAMGAWLNCNDDDDIYAPGALATIAAAVKEVPSVPHLFRFRSYWSAEFWAQRGVVEVGMIGGHCLVAPNVPGKVGRFSCRYEGDFDWVRSTLDHYEPEAVAWRGEIIAIARPS